MLPYISCYDPRFTVWILSYRVEPVPPFAQQAASFNAQRLFVCWTNPGAIPHTKILANNSNQETLSPSHDGNYSLTAGDTGALNFTQLLYLRIKLLLIGLFNYLILIISAMLLIKSAITYDTSQLISDWNPNVSYAATADRESFPSMFRAWD